VESWRGSFHITPIKCPNIISFGLSFPGYRIEMEAVKAELEIFFRLIHASAKIGHKGTPKQG
jgi:hypothetical protein